MEGTKVDINFSEIERYKNLVNLEVSKCAYFNFGGMHRARFVGPEIEPCFDNVVWLQIPLSWTVEDIARFVEGYGDAHIVKDTPSSAYVEFVNMYTKEWKGAEQIVESVNARGKTEGIKACLYKNAVKFRAGAPLASPTVVFGELAMDIKSL